MIMSQLISRSQAKRAGLKTYFNGKACPQGHVAVRKVGSGTCVECSKSATKMWREENQDYTSEYGRLYRSARGEDLLAKKREYQRAWSAANREEKSRRDAQYSSSKRSSGDINFLATCAAKTKRYETAKINATPTWADHDVIGGMYEIAQVFRRVGFDMHVDHIVPLQGKTVSGLHTHDNLQLMIGGANQSKSNRVWPEMP